MSAADVLKLIEESKAKFVDLRFTDTIGKEQHVTVPVSAVDEDFFEEGKMFDGSSISGWKGINDSDMVMLPDTETAVVDPFFQDTTVNIRCDVVNPNTLEGYDRDPRTIAKRAEAYMRSQNVGDEAYFGPENEFFLFDNVRWGTDMNHTFFEVDSEEGFWNSATEYEDGNMGHRPGIKGGYFPVPPVDSHQDVRAAMALSMEEMGLDVEVLHHEVATGGQCELGVKFNTLVKKADEVQIYKYCVHNVAHHHGLSATFMPKPLVGDNGSGMHIHQSIFKDGDSLFAGNEYGGLSKEALYYIGGIFKHAKAINAFANASVNSYRRLVPGYEAPVLLAYSAKNRSASCRIPHSASSKGRRIEIRFPDSTANPYLTFSAMLMAGLDGIRNKIDPGEAMDKDLYDLPPEEEKAIPRVARDLEDALLSLDADREFLTHGDVFSDDMIDAYIALKMEDVDRIKLAVHPAEFDMYYSL